MNHATEIHAYEARKHALTGIYNAGCGHPGGSLSIADILAVLYFEEMNIDPSDPLKQDRDRFVLSKGHCAPILYGILAERVVGVTAAFSASAARPVLHHCVHAFAAPAFLSGGLEAIDIGPDHVRGQFRAFSKGAVSAEPAGLRA